MKYYMLNTLNYLVPDISSKFFYYFSISIISEYLQFTAHIQSLYMNANFNIYGRLKWLNAKQKSLGVTKKNFAIDI